MKTKDEFRILITELIVEIVGKWVKPHKEDQFLPSTANLRYDLGLTPDLFVVFVTKLYDETGVSIYDLLNAQVLGDVYNASFKKNGLPEDKPVKNTKTQAYIITNIHEIISKVLSLPKAEIRPETPLPVNKKIKMRKIIKRCKRIFSLNSGFGFDNPTQVMHLTGQVIMNS